MLRSSCGRAVPVAGIPTPSAARPPSTAPAGAQQQFPKFRLVCMACAGPVDSTAVITLCKHVLCKVCVKRAGLGAPDAVCPTRAGCKQPVRLMSVTDSRVPESVAQGSAVQIEPALRQLCQRQIWRLQHLHTVAAAENAVLKREREQQAKLKQALQHWGQRVQALKKRAHAAKPGFDADSYVAMRTPQLQRKGGVCAARRDPIEQPTKRPFPFALSQEQPLKSARSVGGWKPGFA